MQLAKLPVSNPTHNSTNAGPARLALMTGTLPGKRTQRCDRTGMRLVSAPRSSRTPSAHKERGKLPDAAAADSAWQDKIPTASAGDRFKVIGNTPFEGCNELKRVPRTLRAFLGDLCFREAHRCKGNLHFLLDEAYLVNESRVVHAVREQELSLVASSTNTTTTWLRPASAAAKHCFFAICTNSAACVRQVATTRSYSSSVFLTPSFVL
eukprot:CAMPEP_0204116338 /NCGR_PEP_ID=MMETSP0361-20130328/5346_1 /ASSEMBLY_ACC=CAM_ASM_000343 /TAXON_ID=268821 /ORGANISM="Scrippsiella Hangoei, Strain SHTV-5" /LENGTH=208 /DNA_ID=CAMNT_0051067109 /DNA_START=753 /DNA_END=1380 /DNA_ORIENTATION=+